VKKLFKNTALISTLTLVSRILGVVRDASIAIVFGTTIQSDAFFIAFRPYDMLRKLFSEGILSISFIPEFTRLIQKKGKSEAFAMAFSFFFFLSILGIIIFLFGLFFSPVIVNAIAPGFLENTYVQSLTIILLKIMLPYFGLIMITALCMGILNAMANFGIPAAAPIVFNMVIILFASILTAFFEVPIMALSVGVTVGGILQLAIQIPVLIRLGLLKNFKFRLFHPSVLKIGKIMIPCMIGAGAYQINIMAASFFASQLNEGSVSYLYFADRLVQFPLALFAVSTAIVFLPELSKKVIKGQMSDVSKSFANGVQMVLFVTIPAMAGLLALNDEIVTLLFGYGQFDAVAIFETAQVLSYLVLGLWAFTGVRLFVTLYFAIQEFKTPFLTGVLMIILNIILCQLLIESLGLNGLALAVSVSSMVGLIVLFINLPNAMTNDKIRIIVSACRSVFLSAIMFFTVKMISTFIAVPEYGRFWFAIGVISCIGIGAMSYFLMNVLLSTPEIQMLKRGFKNRESV
jgi:putative peptidoglycan lipid II flippase